MPTFPLKTFPDANGFFSFEDSMLRHLLQVLRKKEGESFAIVLPDGNRGLAKLKKIEGQWLGQMMDQQIKPPLPMLPLWLGIGMIRWSRLEWLVEKATELGVQRISPLIMQQGRYPPSASLSEQKITRLHKIAQETLKQCERAQAPSIDSPQAFSQWIAETKDHPGPKLLFSEKEAPRLNSAQHFSQDQPHLFVIGPEGGFNSDELNLAQEEGFSLISLGPKILKTETAALYGICCLDTYLSNESKRS